MYSQQTLFFDLAPVDTSAKNYVNLVGSTGVVGEFAVVRRCSVKRLVLWLKVASVDETVSAVVTYRLRPTFGSATGQTSLGTITVPTAQAIGTVLYKDIQNVTVPAGYTIAFDLTTAGTSAGSAAGTALCFVDLQPTSEDEKNETNMVKSA